MQASRCQKVNVTGFYLKVEKNTLKDLQIRTGSVRSAPMLIKPFSKNGRRYTEVEMKY